MLETLLLELCSNTVDLTSSKQVYIICGKSQFVPCNTNSVARQLETSTTLTFPTDEYCVSSQNHVNVASS